MDKSYPTFEGLRQVVYESSLRKRIQLDNPNSKRIDKVIKSIQFVGNEPFSPKKIYLNPDLNTIIGGKSSGKSLLLYYIANSIDYEYANKQHHKEDPQQPLDIYKFSEKDEFDFIVEWEDGVEYHFKNNQTKKERPFVYIPQSYIIKLTENIGNNSRKQLGKFIRQILLQENESQKNYDIFISNVKKLDTVRNEAINKYFSVYDEIKLLLAQQKNIGDITGINNQISILEEKIKVLKGCSINDNELKRYELLNNRLDSIEKIENNVSNDFQHWEQTVAIIKNSLDHLATQIKPLTSQPPKYSSSLFNETKSLLNGTWNDFHKIKTQGNILNIQLKERISNLKTKIEGKLQPLKQNLKHNVQIKSIEDEVKKEKGKLLEIDKINNTIVSLNVSLQEQKAILFQGYKDAYCEYETIIDTLNTRALSIKDVELIGSIKFYQNRFKSNVVENINQRSSIKYNKGY